VPILDSTNLTRAELHFRFNAHIKRIDVHLQVVAATGIAGEFPGWSLGSAPGTFGLELTGVAGCGIITGSSDVHELRHL